MQLFSLHNKQHAGFTLIEVMVAVSIFAIVVTVGIGSLMTVNKSYRQSQAQRTVIDNLSFAMESMVREIRIGQEYTCGASVIYQDFQDCQSPYFSFVSFDINDDGVIDTGDEVTYYWDQQNQKIMMSISGTPAEALTADTVQITDMWFEVFEGSIASPRQPYVVIHIAANVTIAEQTSTLVLQTSVSQRKLNIIQ